MFSYSDTSSNDGTDDIGILLTGGMSSGSLVSSTEFLGAESCYVPPLPEPRYGHGTFLTQSGEVAVCGGAATSTTAASNDITSGCLVLDTVWRGGVLSNSPQGWVNGVIDASIGTYMVHSVSTSFLKKGSKQWVTGPKPEIVVYCATELPESQPESGFILSGGLDAKTLRQYIYNGDRPVSEAVSNAGWRHGDTWPSALRTPRVGLACATVEDMVVFAGGKAGWSQEVLDTVEILDFSKWSSSEVGNNLIYPRAFFQLVRLGDSVYSKLLAVGGRNGSSTSDTMEWWDPRQRSWTEIHNLPVPRSHLGAVATKQNMVCVKCTEISSNDVVLPITSSFSTTSTSSTSTIAVNDSRTASSSTASTSSNTTTAADDSSTTSLFTASTFSNSTTAVTDSMTNILSVSTSSNSTTSVDDSSTFSLSSSSTSYNSTTAVDNSSFTSLSSASSSSFSTTAADDSGSTASLSATANTNAPATTTSGLSTASTSTITTTTTTTSTTIATAATSSGFSSVMCTDFQTWPQTRGTKKVLKYLFNCS